MADPDPAHVEAVARAWGSVFPDGSLGHLFAQDRARAFLTSTDPDVHAALLAALVRAGILEEEPTIEVHEDGRPTYYVGYGSQATYHPRRRYATRWEDVDA